MVKFTSRFYAQVMRICKLIYLVYSRSLTETIDCRPYLMSSIHYSYWNLYKLHSLYILILRCSFQSSILYLWLCFNNRVQSFKMVVFSEYVFIQFMFSLEDVHWPRFNYHFTVSFVLKPLYDMEVVIVRPVWLGKKCEIHAIKFAILTTKSI